MAKIAGLLDTLFVVRGEIAKVQAEIENVAAPLFAAKAQYEAEAKGLETEIKSKAAYVSDPHTLRGKNLQLVYSETGRWDAALLGALAAKYGIPDEDLEACKTISPAWSIRTVGKSK